MLTDDNCVRADLTADDITARTRPDEDIPLSFSQEQLWLLQSIESGLTAYNLPTVIRLQGRLVVDALERAFNAVIERHAILRTRFFDRAGVPMQRVQRHADFSVGHLDLSRLHGDEREHALQRAIDAVTSHVFDLSVAPALVARLVRLADDEHVLCVCLHHIVSDAWSNPVLADDLTRAYRSALRTDGPVHLPALAVQYADYALWQRECAESGELARQLARVNARLGERIPALDLPVDRARPARPTFNGATRSFELDEALIAGLQRLCRAEKCTPFMVLFAAWQILLTRYSGQRDFAIGVPNAGRNREEIHGLLGFFVTMQVFRVRLSAQMPFRDALRQVRADALAAMADADVPFELLLESRKERRDPARNPLFQVMFGSQADAGSDAPGFDGLTTHAMGVETGNAKVDLSLDVSIGADGVQGALEYNTDLFDAATAERLTTYYRRTLAMLAFDTDSLLGRLTLPDGTEQAQVLRWGENRTRYDGTQPVHALFERQVEARPDAVALIYGDTQLSYRELNEAANRVAHELIARGVAPEVKVGLALERGIGMAVGVLGVLKSGGAYVPLDPQYPAERLSQMMEDSGLKVVLCESGLRAQLPQVKGVDFIALDALDLSSRAVHNPGVPLHGGNLAYQIYTSGSTGRPKGIGITHAALAEHSLVAADCFGLVPGERMLQFSTINFDGFIDQFFAPLAAGAAVVLRGPTLWDSGTFYREVIERGISVADLPTAYWHLLAQDFARHGERGYGALRQVQATGEAMPPEGVKAWREAGLAHVRLLNTYGPTETVVTATAHDCAAYIDGRESLPLQMPVGRPLAGRHVYVLDAELNLAPVGVAGELYIGGALLARGYHGRAGLSAERFTADPFAAGERQAHGGRLYRTGDVVRWNARGELEYLGRTDHQVKVRGFRIELGEIEAQLLAQPGVREAVVVARQGVGGAKLVGYVSMRADQAADALAQSRADPPADPAAITARLHTALAAALPDYMVPSALTVLESLPLNANGKVDRHALPEPHATPDAGYEAPQGEVEEALAQIWSEVLAVEKISRHDNFFELGGHSLLALKLVDRIQRRLGKTAFVISDIFSFPDLCGQAMRMDTDQAADHTANPGVVVLNREGTGMPLYCFAGIYGNTDEFAALARALAADRPVYGFICHTLTRDRLDVKTFTELAQERARYIAATAPLGRCGIVGWSAGGDLAYETARVLAGEVDVAMLGMVDLSDRVETTRRFDEFESAGAVDTKNPLPERLTTWLAESAMRQSWLDFFERLDWRERRLAFSFLGELNEPLPVDGPSLSSREFDLWAVMSLIWMEHRLKLHEGAKAPVRVWTAEATQENPALICRPWSSFTHVDASMLIPGTTHRSILDHPDFLHDVRQSLLAADREPSVASSPAPPER